MDYFIYLIGLPSTCYGLAVLNDDDTYTILINKDMPREKQEEAVLHELNHIRLGHFQSSEPISQKEWEAI